MTVPASDVLFVAGGEALARYGTIRKRTAIFEEVVENHTRSSVAVGRDRGGVLRSHENDLPVIEWVDEDGDGVLDTPSVLLQGAGQNELTPSEDLTHADWSQNNLSAVNADQATGPDNATSLDEIVEDGTTAGHYVFRNVTGMTADANYALAAWYKANTRSWAHMLMWENGTFANRVHGWFDLSTGATGSSLTNGTGSFVRSYIEDWTDVVAGLYRCVLVASVGNSATSIVFGVGLADADSSASHAGDGTSSLYAGYAQLEDDAEFASSYIATTTAALPRSADTHYHEWLVPPIGMTVYVKFVESGTVLGSQNERLFQIGAAAVGSDPRFWVGNDASGAYDIAHDNGTTTPRVSLSASPSIGDTVEIRAVLKADGSVLIGQSIDGAAETTAEDATTATLQAAWADTRLYLNSGGTSFPGHNAFLSLKIAEGVQTMSDMRAVQ